jgi:glutamyl-tRNA reductase
MSASLGHRKSGIVSNLAFNIMGLINLHLIIFWLIFSGTACAFTTKTTSSVKKSGCPFKCASQFIASRSSFFRQLPSTLDGLSALPQSVLDVSTMSLKVNIPSMTMINTNSPSSSSSRYHRPWRREFRLLATTADAEAKTEIKSKTNDGETKKTKKKKRDGSSGPLEVVVLGLSHHNAKVDIREKLAIPEYRWNEVSAQLCESAAVSEAAVLSTCNRFEVYIAGENQYDAIRSATEYFEKMGGLDQKTLRENLFMLSGEDAIWHLLRVSAGLDSIVVGEGQILSQVKRAYEHGEEEDGSSGKVIARMLNTAIAAGKRVRSETGISKGAVSISSAAVEFTATKVKQDCGFDTMEEAKVTILGAGTMARLLLVHLQTQGVREVTIVNRSPTRVLALQEEFPDLTINVNIMDEMWNVIENSDIVYPSTSSESIIIDAPELEAAIERRKANRPGGLHIVDISVPRNVAKECENIPNVGSYNVDNLKEVVAKNTAKRRKEMVEAEGILRDEMAKYRTWQQSLGAIPTIAKLQEKAELMRQEEWEKAAKKLSNLSAKDQEAVERLSKGIVAKLLHGPMNHLRQSKDRDDTIAAIDQVKRAFQLEDK